MAANEQFTKSGDGLLVRAPGKINLSLLVSGKRDDGYHNIETIMAKISWYDEIFIEKLNENFENQKSNIKNQNYESPDASQESNFSGTGKPEIELICKGEYKVPQGEENLVYKAAKLIQDTAGRAEGVRLTLTKNMPAGSGLGSGSSDAAATLMGINRFFKLDLGKKELAGLAAKLGSDVAFFLDGPLALCTGRGEKVKKLEECEFGALLIIPDISVSTKRVYENYEHDEAKYRRLSEEINLYIEKKRIDLVCRMCANMLQESCFELYKELKELKEKIERTGVRPMCLSGSGSSIYCIINQDNEKGVRTYRDKLEQEFSCRSINVNNNSW